MTVEEIRAKKLPHDPVKFQQMKERYRLQTKFITHPVTTEIEKILASGDRVELIPCKDCVKIIRVKRKEVTPGGKRSDG